MNFNKHSNLEGQHAFLGASKYHWINYSDEKVAEAYSKFLATKKEQSYTNLLQNVYSLDKNCLNPIRH